MIKYRNANGELIEFEDIIKIIKDKIFNNKDHYVVIGCDSQKHKKKTTYICCCNCNSKYWSWWNLFHKKMERR